MENTQQEAVAKALYNDWRSRDPRETLEWEELDSEPSKDIPNTHSLYGIHMQKAQVAIDACIDFFNDNDEGAYV